MSTMVNVLGAGFVGGEYARLTPNVIVNDRNDYEVKSDQVLYFISTVDNYNVWTDPYIDIDTNLTTLIKTLETCKGKDVTFNFVSSWFVYGNVDLPAKEIACCDPKGFYSITKRAAEQLLISYCETFKIKYRILRLANVLGASDKKVSKKKNALQYMIRELQAGNTVQLYDGGEAYRDYIYVTDAIRAINLVLEKGKVNEIYNIGNGVPIRLVDAITYAAQKLSVSHHVESVATAEFHKVVQTTNMVLDVTKIKQLGYVQNYTIYDIIDELII
jgi:nucleoside-diphosphate-sugar epimerase